MLHSKRLIIQIMYIRYNVQRRRLEVIECATVQYDDPLCGGHHRAYPAGGRNGEAQPPFLVSSLWTRITFRLHLASIIYTQYYHLYDPHNRLA